MVKRKSISKKTRFEIFKRDNFTCQYCGKKAPDVILEIDHIVPVSKGGTNKILNLVTACKDCNRGKTNIELNDNQVIERERKQLEELQERREQIKLLGRWHKELELIDEEKIEIINQILLDKADFSLSDSGKTKTKKLIKKYGLEEVIESTNISIDQYYEESEDSEKVFDYIGRICNVRNKTKVDEQYQNKAYIRGIIKNRFSVYNEGRLAQALNTVVIDNETFEIVKEIAITCKNWSSFFATISNYFGIIM